ncbi:MAG: TIGR04182 family glycosyltransferase, partial [Haloferacaceae archaeon]
FLELYRKAKTNNPLFYFGSAGVAATAAGLGMGAFVLYRYLAFNVSHEVIAVGAVGATILGIQLLVFGVLADMIHSLHEEQIARYERTLGAETRGDAPGGDRDDDRKAGKQRRAESDHRDEAGEPRN